MASTAFSGLTRKRGNAMLLRGSQQIGSLCLSAVALADLFQLVFDGPVPRRFNPHDAGNLESLRSLKFGLDNRSR